MVFTDDDLKRLKEQLSGEDTSFLDWYWPLGHGELGALLARLEAAEECLEKTRGVGAHIDEYMAWRKACGK